MISKLILIATAALVAAEAAAAGSTGADAAIAAGGRLPAGAAGAERGIRQITRNLDRVFVAARRQLARLSRLGSVRAQDGSACNSEMAAHLRSPRFTIIGASDRAGDLYCASQPLSSPVSIADRPYFLRAIGIRGYAVGDFQVGKLSGIKALGMGYPTRGADGAVNGLVFSDLSVSWLDRRIGGERPRGALDVLVVDEHGTVLARAGKSGTTPGRNLGAKSLVRAMVANDRGIGAFRLADRPVISAFDVVRPTGGAVHVAVSVRR